jgi:hypothetical protein
LCLELQGSQGPWKQAHAVDPSYTSPSFLSFFVCLLFVPPQTSLTHLFSNFIHVDFLEAKKIPKFFRNMHV